ncbi:MAG: 23S rRNA (uracil(1939)-C(5))-methyltransferase RlmD [Flavobacteriales bacterium]
MARNKRLFKRGQIIELEITDMAFGGKGLGRVETEKGPFVVFVMNTIPGQLVKARVAKSKKNHAECKLVEVVRPSEKERPVSYQPIPGAPYVTLPVEDQIAFKKATTFDLFRKIGKVPHVEDLFDEFISSPSAWHYRNKMEYSFSAIRYDLETKEELDEFGLGFKKRGTWWIVENLDKDSGIFDKQFEDSMKPVREWLISTGLPAWHPPKQEGFFRYLQVRKSFKTDQLLINLVTTSNDLDKFDISGFVELMKGKLEERLGGLIHTINDQIGDRVEAYAGNTTVLYGQPKLVETINDLDFEISVQSFFQTNPKCAEKLYDKVISYAGDTSDESIIMDMFCGTGTISQLLAKGTQNTIVGVDIVESAIADAQANAKRNNISNVKFHAADVGKFLFQHPEYSGKINTIVLDPPRAGIAPKTLLKVIALGASRIVYVSCNPATQARDTETLLQSGYELKKLSMVDQFPHTGHVESIALFEK